MVSQPEVTTRLPKFPDASDAKGFGGGHRGHGHGHGHGCQRRGGFGEHHGERALMGSQGFHPHHHHHGGHHGGHFRRHGGSPPGAPTDFATSQRAHFKHLKGGFCHGREDRLEKMAGKGRPRTNVSATSEAYVLTMEVAGLNQGDAAVDFQTEETSFLPVVIVEGERKAQPLVEGASMLLQERPAGQFKRRFVFPADAAHTAAAISQNDGLLTVTIPRRHEGPAPRPQQKDGDMSMDA